MRQKKGGTIFPPLSQNLDFNPSTKKHRPIACGLFDLWKMSKVAEQNLPLPQLQKILGHSNIQSTMIYLEMSQKAIKDGLNAVELF